MSKDLCRTYVDVMSNVMSSVMSNFMSNNSCRKMFVQKLSRIVCRNFGRTIKRVKPRTGEAVRSHPPLVLHNETNDSQWYHTHAWVLQIPHRIKRGLFLHDNLFCRCCVSSSIVACCQECMAVSLECYLSVVPVFCPWCFGFCFCRFLFCCFLLP